MAGGERREERDRLLVPPDLERDHAQTSGVDSRPATHGGERRAVGVVGDLDHVRAPVGFTVRPGEAQVERLGVGSEHSGERGQRGVDLGIAVLRRSHDRRVQAEGDVVDEDPPVDLGEIHRSLLGLPERIERPHHVVAIEPQIECQVIACPGGDDHHRNTSLGGDARHERLRSIAAGHPDHVGPSVDRTARQVEQIVSLLEDHRLDIALAALLLQVEPFGLPAA